MKVGLHSKIFQVHSVVRERLSGGHEDQNRPLRFSSVAWLAVDSQSKSVLLILPFLL